MEGTMTVQIPPASVEGPHLFQSMGGQPPLYESSTVSPHGIEQAAANHRSGNRHEDVVGHDSPALPGGKDYDQDIVSFRNGEKRGVS